MNVENVRDASAFAAVYLRIALEALDRGVKLEPGSIETNLAEDLQTVVLMCDLPDGDTLVDGFVLAERTTEEEFYS